jgi:isoleucyl-tRNA synthetase
MTPPDSPASSPYPDAPPQPSFPELEERVLARWRKDRTFERSIEQRPAGEGGANEYVFYDGPPFANGTPHFGHLLTGYVKDIVPRYQTLRGRRVERRFGWDCHGLPAEMEAEKELGVSGRAAIIEYGIDNFNDYCRGSVLRYTEQWQETIHRSGRWVDFKNDYKTMDLSYMESVLWAFKTLWDKGLLYEDLRVMPYSWAAQTPVSNFETRMDNSTRERQDPALTVRFELESAADDDVPTDLLAWTTTPWTLPSNLALAVGPEIDYAVLAHEGRRVILGEACVAKYEAELGTAERVGSVFRSSPTRRVPSACSARTSSTSRRARARSTWRRASARTTWRCATPRASPWSYRWTRPATSPARSRPGRARTCSRPTRASSAP